MSNQYIPQINNQNFVYPNYDLAEYDVDIIHDINNNSVSGVVTSFSAITVSSSSITVRFTNTWVKNGAEVFIRTFETPSPIDKLQLFSLHVMATGQEYYKPWRLIDFVNTTSTGATSVTTTNRDVTFTASQLGISSFTNGVYNFEFRFIGLTSVFPVCASITVNSLSTPTPTPTPTLTPTPTPTATGTPTPTPTPGGVTPTPTPTPTVTPTPTPSGSFTSGATINVTDTGYIKYRKKGEVSDTYVFISSLGNYTITDCLTCSTIMIGIPFADVANFTLITCGAPC
jgi:hypothetical protein